MEKRLFIVSDRLPFTFSNEPVFPQTAGDRLTAMVSHWRKWNKEHFDEVCWAGVPGCHPASWYNHVAGKAHGPITYLPVFTSVSEYDRYHNGLCKAILEPIFNASTTTATDYADNYPVYRQVNQRFADTLLKRLRPGDTLWIQDYHLMPLAALLREAIPELTIGLSLHLPFPEADQFRCLPQPWQKELLLGMLGADLIDFQSGVHASYFLQNVLSLLGLDHEQNILHHDNRLVKVSVFPVIAPLPASPHGPGWINDFIHELLQIKKQQQYYQVRFFDDFTRRQVFDRYRSSGNRLLLLDYDGTLVPFSATPAAAIPSQALLDILETLSATAGNDLYIISGRSRSWLQQHFGALPINLVAEHGACYKEKGSWYTSIKTSQDWKKDVSKIMALHVSRCEHSFVEEKEFSMVWHYRNAPNEQGSEAANALATALHEYVHNRGLHVMLGNKIVEIKESAVNKGLFAQQLLQRKQYDFALSVGDDTTDEDMFKALLVHPDAVTIKVGASASYARFNLHTPQTVISFLQTLQYLPQETVPNR